MKFFKSLSTYALVGFIGAGINFFLMPYLSHFLSPEDYGIIAIFNSCVTLFIPLVGLVAAGLITVEYYQLDDKKEFASLFSSVQLIPLVPFIILAIISLLYKKELATWLDIGASSADWIFTIPLLALLTVYVDSCLGFLIIKKKAMQYAIFNISKLILEVTLTVIFVTNYRWGWEGRLWSWLIATTLFTIVSFIYFGRLGLLTINIKKKHIVAGLIYGTPLILHTVGKFVINQSDRIFIAKMISPKEAGIYNAGYTIGSILLIVITAIQGVITPFLFERLADLTPRRKLEIVKMSYAFIGLMLVCLIGITVCSPLYFNWFMDERYLGGVSYVFWVAFGYFFWGIYIVFSGYIFYVKKTGILAVLAVVNVVTNLLFNYWFINIYGPLGAAYATCLSFAIIAISVIAISTRYYSLPWLNFQMLLKGIKK